MSRKEITSRKIGRLWTPPLQDHNGGGEIGQFDLPITLNNELLMTDSDRPGYIRTIIAHHLAHAVFQTQVPMEMWRCELEDAFAFKFSLPTTFSFDKRKLQ